ncbi:hypothetical protein [Nocardia heshunensis]
MSTIAATTATTIAVSQAILPWANTSHPTSIPNVVAAAVIAMVRAVMIPSDPDSKVLDQSVERTGQIGQAPD